MMGHDPGLPGSTMVVHGYTTMVDHVFVKWHRCQGPWSTIVDHGQGPWSGTIVYHIQFDNSFSLTCMSLLFHDMQCLSIYAHQY